MEPASKVAMLRDPGTKTKAVCGSEDMELAV